MESKKVMSLALAKKGYHVEAFGNGADAIKYIQNEANDIDLVITDLRMPGVDGLTVLKETKQVNPDLSVLLVTGFASVENAVEAMKLGAEDYLTKPIDLFEFRARVSKLINHKTLKGEVDLLHKRLDKRFGFEQIVGKSQQMERLFEMVRTVANTNANVLIMGESGTGKELIANAIHQNSPKKDQRFLPINCAAIPPDILESELFGHERGSFTGAITRKIGKFELANNGTIFLDEIGDMSLDLQVKLLRVLENREFMRVGGSEMIRINSRFVFATNKNLEAAIKDGSFREDLYYRINVVNLKIPPLRERREDLADLVAHFVAEFSKTHQKQGVDVTPDLMQTLTQYAWPGNVRELRNLVENLMIFAKDGCPLTRDQLPAHVFSRTDKNRRITIPFGTTMAELEKEAIYQTLEAVSGNKTRAAEVLQVGLRTLQRKLKDYESGTDSGEDTDGD
ncbi:MAG: sigma-54-dependent Fis family transcriptional regulator [Acidobacteria bacterium]|nr:sigma-54-dependent Fis family transcriptional regulator [Acidobacteriota bacterium]